MVLGGALGPGFVACDARGAAPLCVAGVALGDIHLDITWQAWHLVTSTFVSPPWYHVAGVALGDIYLRFTWQAWHKLTSTVVLRGRRGTYGTGWRPWAGICRLWRPGRRATLRGRRGTWWHLPLFHVAGVAQTHIYRRFAWQAWHSWGWVARLGRFGRGWRRGTLCALGPVWSRMTPRHFAWQAWHNLTSTFVLHGRRGTISHPPSFHVAGVAQSHIHLRFAWQAWHLVTSIFVLRGRHGTWRHPPLFCHIPSLSHTTLSHTIFHTSSLTHHLGHTIFHTTLSHTIFDTPSQAIFHTPSFIHRFVSHHLSPHHPSHTTLSHTIFYAPSQTISHTPSLTTPSFTHQLCHTPSFTQLGHAPTLSHTIFHTPTLSHTIFHTPSFTHRPSQAIFHTPPFTQHNTLSHTIFHTNLSPTNFVTYHLSHTIFRTPSQAIFHTPSFTHHFVTHHLSHTTLSHATFKHTIFHTTLSHTHTPDTIFLCHTSFHIQLCHTQFCFTSRSSTTSFVFPSFPIPATTFGAFYWRKLSCGAIRSFNFQRGGSTTNQLYIPDMENQVWVNTYPALPPWRRDDLWRLRCCGFTWASFGRWLFLPPALWQQWVLYLGPSEIRGLPSGYD